MSDDDSDTHIVTSHKQKKVPKKRELPSNMIKVQNKLIGAITNQDLYNEDLVD
jgi:hypothetical protein